MTKAARIVLAIVGVATIGLAIGGAATTPTDADSPVSPGLVFIIVLVVGGSVCLAVVLLDFVGRHVHRRAANRSRN